MRPGKGVERRDHVKHAMEMKQQKDWKEGEDWNPSVLAPNKGWLAGGRSRESELFGFPHHPALPRAKFSANLPSLQFNVCVATILHGDSVSRWLLFIPSPIRTLKGQRERDCGKNSAVGVCSLGAGFEVAGALECGRGVRTELCGLQKEAGEAGP